MPTPQARPSVRKLLFSAADEAQAWLTSNRGEEGHGWKYCAKCGAGRVQSRDRPHPRARTDPAGAGEQDEADGWLPGVLAAPDSWPADALPFAMPASQPIQLPVRLRLASWNKAGDPNQVRLAGYLDVAEELLGPSLEKLNGPLALRLDVGLPGPQRSWIGVTSTTTCSHWQHGSAG